MPGLDSSNPLIDLPGVAKASVLLIALGAGVSSSVMQQLTPDEVERLTAEIVRLRKIDPEIRRRVLDECKKALVDEISSGGIDYARAVLGQVLGEVKAREVLDRLVAGGNGAGAARWLRTIPPRQLAQSLTGERPQVVALVLGHLPAEMAAQVLSALPVQCRAKRP